MTVLREVCWTNSSLMKGLFIDVFTHKKDIDLLTASPSLFCSFVTWKSYKLAVSEMAKAPQCRLIPDTCLSCLRGSEATAIQQHRASFTTGSGARYCWSSGATDKTLHTAVPEDSTVLASSSISSWDPVGKTRYSFWHSTRVSDDQNMLHWKYVKIYILFFYHFYYVSFLV